VTLALKYQTIVFASQFCPAFTV